MFFTGTKTSNLEVVHFLPTLYQNNWVVEMPDYNLSDSLLNLFESQWRQYSFFHF